jgi:hypothetical protein
MNPGAIPAHMDVSIAPVPEPLVRMEVVSSSMEKVEVGRGRISILRGVGAGGRRG